MNIYVLASGSKGNVTVIENEGRKVLIDCGISYKKLLNKLEEASIKIEEINDIIITHEHKDHVVGLNMLLKHGFVNRVYMTLGTKTFLQPNLEDLFDKVDLNVLIPNHNFEVINLDVTPIDISHDANEPIGLVIKNEIKKAVILTDTGYVDRAHHEILSDADFYLLESNHDTKMLLNSKRPHLLKQRIMGITGHLSNDEAAELMNKLIINKKAIWVIAHISEDCNNVFSIEEAIVNNFDDPTKVEIYYSSQESLDVFKL